MPKTCMPMAEQPQALAAVSPFHNSSRLFLSSSLVPFPLLCQLDITNLTTGPTITGSPPFLVQSNPAPFGHSRSFVPNAPLETAQPISGAPSQKSIFQLLGNYCPYFPNPDGFGVDEYPLPAGANISQVHVLHRHGARYPNLTTGVDTVSFGERLTAAAGKFNATGALSFLNTWKYRLGVDIQVPFGRQE